MARDHQRRRCVIVAGPTAGGKSALAADIAEAAGGTVINADSMQVYDGLAVVTAQPSAADRARVPHVLYGTVPPDARYSAGRWAEAATAAAEGAWAAGRLPVFCGGTGFYLETLTRGLSPIPAVPDAVRAAVAERRTAQDPARFHGALAAVDPAMAARLDPADGQRIARALEVFEATGKTLSDWQADAPPQPMLDAETLTLVAAPDRGTLYAAIDARFETMVQAGAADEVRALLDRRLDPALPAMAFVAGRSRGRRASSVRSFGYPGGAVLPIYDALFQQKPIRHILVRQEGGAVHAAEGYARSTGKVGVRAGDVGSGRDQRRDRPDRRLDGFSMPLVCLSGQVPTHLIGNDAFQECDTTGITRPCTKHNYLVKDVDDLAGRCTRRSTSRAAAAGARC
jgi:tRNA dimethylallyltransferase